MDYTCVMHGKKMSEHTCLYCCLCFSNLSLDECYIGPDGSSWDVCKECAEHEKSFNFIYLCGIGVRRPEEIDDCVERWHEGSGKFYGQELHEYLGMTIEEYGQWLRHPDSLEAIIEAHKK